MFIGAAANTNFNVFGLTRPGIEPTFFRTRGEHTNHLTTNAVEMIIDKHLSFDGLNKCITKASGSCEIMTSWQELLRMFATQFENK